MTAEWKKSTWITSTVSIFAIFYGIIIPVGCGCYTPEDEKPWLHLIRIFGFLQVLSLVSLLFAQWILAKKLYNKQKWMIFGPLISVVLFILPFVLEHYFQNIMTPSLIVISLFPMFGIYHLSCIAGEKLTNTIMGLIGYVIGYIILIAISWINRYFGIYYYNLGYFGTIFVAFVLSTIKIFLLILKKRNRNWKMIFLLIIVPFIYLPVLALRDIPDKTQDSE